MIHDKTKPTKCVCFPGENSDKPGHPPSLIRVFAVCSVGNYGSKLSLVDGNDSDQTALMLFT